MHVKKENERRSSCTWDLNLKARVLRIVSKLITQVYKKYEKNADVGV